eukprot:CAMPEP_0202962406 /NCGR_PEP_ID=MMETSP1396-20130829/6512_1 /ASSEMBLY_ACC=CAM_ASM_000872 /TAXON_ID= /ORGANISM="Pseudokeronopsis sp., Strain Brazil" /LENGTH=115 /DNA_ID=CAMNT_0049682963 /DNA_START=925 /DNA_END=1272 /DNA_ORIENTATION=+
MTDAPITFIVPHTHIVPFTGWYLEAYPHVIDKVMSGKFEIRLVEDEWANVEGFELKTLLTHEFEDNRMLHFATNAVPCFRDDEGRFMVFSGDFFKPPIDIDTNEEFIEALSSWLR